ncbi:Tetratricopeptide repeat protein 15 [Papilio machaon]|uniref:Tetratricopeptide repeat protein 15 n=1 Tax=Papilio machaon TaxID=76193 RepID=A0A0N0PCP1_PAPMA|nr:Tetratricopeptide repeat protein 15 [Papilio machaon]
MPGLVLEEELADALQEVAVKYLGVSSAGSRGVVRAEHVSRDEAGLRELLRTGYLRAAVNLTATLLAAAGQGVGRMHRPTKHTPRSLQLWLTRFAVMLRIKLHEPLLKEAEPFGDLSKPDMFYQFYPEAYENRTGSLVPFSLRLLIAELPGHVGKPEEAADRLYVMLDIIQRFYPEAYENRTGSLVPFSLRLLIAELPGHVGKPEEAADRLYVMLDIIQRMLSNLQQGKSEDGSGTITEPDKLESIRLWTGRQTRVLHSIDYRLASKILVSLEKQASSPAQKRALSSALCRLWLLAGHLKAAMLHLEDARETRHHLCPTPDVREYVDLGLIDIAYGKYQDAYNNFARAAEQEPTNIMVANNLSVCLLYMGRLKEAIAVLQKAINSDPERGLNESLLINLCTLYELESSKTNEKKLNLLRMLCKHKSDTIPNVLECLKLA